MTEWLSKHMYMAAQEGITYSAGGWPHPRTPEESGHRPPGGRGWAGHRADLENTRVLNEHLRRADKHKEGKIHRKPHPPLREYHFFPCFILVFSRLFKHIEIISYIKLQESESEVAQLCPTLFDPKDCSPPGSSIHGIFQARILE